MSLMKPGKKPFDSKVCPACGVDKPRAEYYKKGQTVSYRCKPCTLVDLKTRSPNYFGKYSEYQNQWRRNRYQTDPEYRERIAQQKHDSYEKRKDVVNAKRRERWANDPYNPARLYFRRKDVKKRTPPWVSREALLEIYANCPKNKHVDHIVPLKGFVDGNPVTGLHVPWNLQYLSPSDNLRKSNRVSLKEALTLVKR